MARDIRREIADHLRFQSFSFCVPLGIEETHSPLDLFLSFITDKGIDTEEKLLEFSRIEVLLGADCSISYRTEKKKQEHAYFSAMFSIDDYIGWDELASFFLPSCHKKCRVVYNGQESVITYINSWATKYNAEGKILYNRVKVPIDTMQNRFRRSFLVEDYIVEDEIG